MIRELTGELEPHHEGRPNTSVGMTSDSSFLLRVCESSRSFIHGSHGQVGQGPAGRAVHRAFRGHLCRARPGLATQAPVTRQNRCFHEKTDLVLSVFDQFHVPEMIHAPKNTCSILCFCGSYHIYVKMDLKRFLGTLCIPGGTGYG